MKLIYKEKYTLKDVKRRRKSRKYVAIELKAAKLTDLVSIANQIVIIYNDFDVKF